MHNIGLALVAVPFLVMLVVVINHQGKEAFISRLALTAILLMCALTLVATGSTLIHGPTLVSYGDIYHGSHYDFPLALFIDYKSLVFLWITNGIGLVIIRFSRNYLHREEGYGRFFATIFLFLTGLNLLSVAGSLDLFFAGWEFVGVSSFLLIGFYRRRLLPVKNSLRAFCAYRIADIGLFIGAFLSHVIFGDGLFFADIAGADESDLVASHPGDPCAG